MAWHIAALQRQKKLPALRSLLQRAGRMKPQSPAQHRAAMAVLAAQYGFRMGKTRLKKREAR